jgi:hypothetical protein
VNGVAEGCRGLACLIVDQLSLIDVGKIIRRVTSGKTFTRALHQRHAGLVRSLNRAIWEACASRIAKMAVVLARRQPDFGESFVDHSDESEVWSRICRVSGDLQHAGGPTWT